MAVSCCRNNNDDQGIGNLAFTNNTEVITNDMALQPAHEEEHIYDAIEYDDVDIKQEREAKNKSSSHVNQKNNATIKSDQVPQNKPRLYYVPPDAKEKTHRDKPKLPSKSKPPSKPKYTDVAPVAKAPHHVPTNENMSLEEEYILPDPKYTPDNQYALLDRTQRAENNQYTSLAVPQSYQTVLVNVPHPHPQYTAPRRPPATN